MGAADHADPCQLCRTAVLEKYAFSREAKAVAAKKPARRHPVPRRGTQIDAHRIVMTILRLVTDHEHIDALGATTSQECVRAIKYPGVGNTGSVDVALQALPSEFTVSQQS